MAFRDYAYLQTEPSECGLACLAASAAMLGDKTDLAAWRRRFPVSRGLSLKEMHEIAAAMGLSARSVRCELEDLGGLKAPSILHFGLKHFVVLERAGPKRIHIFDPAMGRRQLTLTSASELFTGVATEITATPAFSRKPQPPLLRLTSLFKWTPQLTGGLIQIAVLSVVLEAYVLASPYYMQLSIDEAALKGDSELLTALAVGFGLFAMFNVVATALRAVVLQKISALLNWEMTVGLFRHLIRLPLPWFQRRRMADVLARFQALDPVKSLIGNGLISALLDGVLSIATGVMLFLYSSTLAWIVTASLVIYMALRLLGIPVTRNFASAAMVASISEQGKRIESLRAIQTIKVMGAEAEREGDWSNVFAATGSAPRTTGGKGASSEWSRLASSRETSARARRANSASASPAAVGASPLGCRSNRRSPTSASISLRARVSAGWLTASPCDARVRLLCRTRASTISRCRNFSSLESARAIRDDYHTARQCSHSRRDDAKSPERVPGGKFPAERQCLLLADCVEKPRLKSFAGPDSLLL